MLINALTEHFNDYFNQDEHHDTVLWFDPGREYAALLDHLTDVPLLRYDGSLLRLRHHMVNREPGERAVVYLPLAMDDADVLRPFFFAPNLVFRTRLYKFLRAQDLAFPDDPGVAHQMRDLLPQLAARSIGKGRTFWEEVLQTLDRVIAELVGDPDNALLRFLSRPRDEMAKLRREGLDELFADLVEGNFGLSLRGDTAGAMAQRLAAQLALVRAYVDAGQPDDYPYTAQLPKPYYFDRCRTFLGRWQRDTQFKGSYKRHAAAVESQYSLDRWVRSLSLPDALRLGATFANVEEALWRRLEKEMADLASETAWTEWLEGHRAASAQRAVSFWAQEGRAPGWQLLVTAADLMVAIRQTKEGLDRASNAAALLNHYAGGWWAVDRDYRLLREALNRQPSSYDRLRKRCAHSYRELLEQMNERFSYLLETEGAWPAGALAPQDRFWEAVMAGRKPGQRMAVLMIDALRYEMAQTLHEQLEQDQAGTERRLIPRLASIPTVTPIGMSAVLPAGRERRVDHVDGKWKVTIGDSRNLKEKKVREEWLAQHLDDVAMFTLEDLLDRPTDDLRQADTIVVFDHTLDAMGENVGKLGWDAFSTLVQSVRKGIYKLLEAGLNQVHVITDHGFLLLEEVGEHEKVSARHAPALAVKERYVVGRGLGVTDQLRFPVPGSDGLEAWFPRGIGCFRSPGAYNYAHGGLSPQELVIPHLTVTQAVSGRPVGVRVEFPDQISNAQFKVTLRPLSEGLLDQPRQVTLALEKGGAPIIPPLSTTVTVGNPAVETVFLPMGCGLAPGDEVRWIVRDAVTEEVLAEGRAESEVDLW